MSDVQHWEQRYQQGDTPWDTGRPSSELIRVVAAEGIAPCRAVDLGCGRGANTLWLAKQGFDAVGVDISARAIEQASARAAQSGVQASFVVADLAAGPDLGTPFRFFFDRGCYHVLRRDGNLDDYLRTLKRLTTPDAVGLVLAGNAREKHEPGPPVVTEEEIRTDLGPLFQIVRLREMRFDGPLGSNEHILGWSCFVRKLSGPQP
jgi:SAM-dependent methyltransferase